MPSIGAVICLVRSGIDTRVEISKGYKGLDPLGLRVLQKLCSESPLLVPRSDVYSFARANPFVEKKQKGNMGKYFHDYYIIYPILFYPFFAMFNFNESILLFAIHGLFLEPSLCQNLSGSKVTSV